MWRKIVILLVLLALLFPITIDQEEKFAQFVSKVQKEARKSGISEKTIHTYLTKVTKVKIPEHGNSKRNIISKPNKPTPPIVKNKAPADMQHVDKVLARQGQQEFAFTQYLKNLTTPEKIQAGIYFYRKYSPLLQQIQAKFQVQPQIIIALWGIESDYGRNMGHSNIVQTLLTLAYQHHRSDFYRQQLIAALKMLDAPHTIPEQRISTWDGGMGHPSFEPTTYLDYGVDFEGTGFKNIWTSLPDALASVANFLHQLGWKNNEPWGIEVTVPKNIPMDQVNQLKNKLPIDQWQSMGVRTLDGKDLPTIDSTAALLLPSGINGRAFLVFRNFNVLMIWNNTYFEGITVGLLSDQILAGANSNVNVPTPAP